MTDLEPLISSHPFAATRPTADALRYLVRVDESICAWGNERHFLMGGVGFGACIDALEHATGLPTIFASAQFISFASVGETVELAVELPAQGRTITQGRVVASVGDRDVLRVTAALGGRNAELDRSWGEMPDVPSPLDCALRPVDHPGVTSIHSALEDRTVPSPAAGETGTSCKWMRVPGHRDMTASLLAFYADFLPRASAIATGEDFSRNSLDNVLRVHHVVPTEWVMIETSISMVARGTFHGSSRLFAEDGTLLATANQSGIARTR